MNTSLTPEQRAKRAEENEKASREAMKLATEAQQRDIEAGQRPVAVDVAEGLKDRLRNEDFSTRSSDQQ